MKNFMKMTLASILGLLIFSVISVFLMFAVVGAQAAAGDKQPVMPQSAVLKIDMSTFTLSEQNAETDPFASLAGNTAVSTLGIYNAVKAINAAAEDPAVKFIYLTPDMATGGLAQIEEFRKALGNFRTSGKAIVSYIENRVGNK